MEVKIKDTIYQIDENEIDISIPIEFNSKKNPLFYDQEIPTKKFYRYNNKEYDINKKGSCNVPIINLNIHCSGTHTETANHIIKTGQKVNNIRNCTFLPCHLITINPGLMINENYHANTKSTDKVITKKLIKEKIKHKNLTLIKSLVIRTTPNTYHKKSYNYNEKTYPFLTNDAVLFLKNLGIENLLIDTPSIDRFDDHGLLGNHHIFFSDNGIPNTNTLTELVYIPNIYKDGAYLLNLGIPNFKLDAAPSRPILFKIIN